MKISEIGTKEIIAWQNELLAYRDEKRNPYSRTYLKTARNQLSAIFNHAVRYYDLRSNPAAKAGNMRSEEHKEMQEYISMLYGLKKKDRIFTVTESYLHHETDRQCRNARNIGQRPTRSEVVPYPQYRNITVGIGKGRNGIMERAARTVAR